METFLHIVNVLELIFFAGTFLGTVVLAIGVYRSNSYSATNKIFSLLCVSTMLWFSTNIVYLPQLALPPLLMTRLAIFFAAPQSALFFLLAYTIPDTKLKLRKGLFIATVASTLVVMILNISPYGFTSAEIINGKLNITPGIGFLPFILLSTLFSILSVYILFKKYIKSIGEARQQILLILIGILLMLALIVITVMLPILFFQSAIFVPLTPVYTLIFLSMTAYAITRYQLFNIKVILTEVLTIIIWIILLSRIFIAYTLTGGIIDSLIFLIILMFGILLIRGARKEAEIKKKLHELDELKSEFVSLATHHISSPITAIMGYTSMLREGDYGKRSEKEETILSSIQRLSNNLAIIVRDFLDISRLDNDEMEYKFAPVDLDRIVGQTVMDYKSRIKKKGLEISYHSESGKNYTISADGEKIQQVIANILDNSIKYTAQGRMDINLSSTDKNIIIEISDTGSRIVPAISSNLSKKFARSGDENEAAIIGNGLGLYVAKRLIEAHHGSIKIGQDVSNGIWKFTIELPKA